jgi:hypothetical protein
MEVQELFMTSATLLRQAHEHLSNVRKEMALKGMTRSTAAALPLQRALTPCDWTMLEAVLRACAKLKDHFGLTCERRMAGADIYGRDVA